MMSHRFIGQNEQEWQVYVALNQKYGRRGC